VRHARDAELIVEDDAEIRAPGAVPFGGAVVAIGQEAYSPESRP
jgi:hypothetical protein